MDDKGWIKLHRKLQDCPLWMAEKYSYGQAWIDLILSANYSDRKMLFDGDYIVVKNGQYLTSIRKLSEKWMWSKDRTLKFLRLLEKEEMITKDSDKRRTIITIINYEVFQNCQDTERTLIGTANGQLPATNKNIKNIKKEKNNTMCKSESSALFEILWKLYPIKKGKGQVSDTQKMRLFKIGQEEMERAIDRYKTELKKDSDWRKPQNGSTFFNSGYVDYLDSNYVPGERSKTQNQFNGFEQTNYDIDYLENVLVSNGIEEIN